MKKKLFSTIKFKVFITLTALIALIFVFCVALSTIFGEDYFIYRVTKNLDTSYHQICAIFENTSLTDEERGTEIEKICNNSNLHAMVFEGDEIAYTSLPRDSERFLRGNSDKDSQTSQPQQEEPYQPAPPPENSGQTEMPPHNPNENKTIIKETEEYQILNSYIPNFDAYNLELVGNYGDMHIILQSSVAAISESIKTFNGFFIFLSIFAVIVAGIFAYFLSKRFTTPIHRLSEIAKKMSELDFSEKYGGGDKGEIGLLGSSINTLSEKLEKNIRELKNANRKLLQDIDIKEKIDQQRRDFLSGVSHELKTPISIIEAYAEGLLEMELSDEDKKYYCDVIADEAGKMNTLIVKLMSLMELEAGSDKIELERYDITEQIQNILEDKKVLFEQNHIVPEFTNTEKCFVWADAFLIEEAIINYLINAMKHSSGKKRLCIWTTVTKEDKVRINVYNSGSHIPESEIENIWNSFYRVDKARTRDGGSKGLGLSIVKAIAAAHNQECGVFNTENGVVFWIEIDKA